MNKSSTFLALLSVISILAIMSIAINDVETSSVRKPFKTTSASNETESTEIENSEDKWKEKAESDFYGDNKELIQFGDKLSDKTEMDLKLTESDLNFDTTKSFTNIIKNSDRDKIEGEEKIVSTLSPEKPNIQRIDNFLENEIFTIERLIKAGIKTPIIQRKPFSGLIFDEIQIDTLTSFDSNFFTIVSKNEIGKTDLFDVLVFDDVGADMASEIYDLIKMKFEGVLGLTINEKNDFGLKSFYLNFQPPKENVFLVVKYKESVYALSYPRSKNNDLGVNYHELIKKLL